LLDQGTSPEAITWIRPRDAWLPNRKFFQPSAEGVLTTFEGVVLQLEALVECDTVEEIFERLEESEVMLRTDPSVTPTMIKGGTVSLGELHELQRIDDVVRLGHVRRIDVDEIVLEQGSIPTSPDNLHVHCASFGLGRNPPKPIWDDGTITLQVVTRGSLPLSAALIAFVESSDRTIDEKNCVCVPQSWPDTPFDWLRMILGGMKTEVGWQDHDLQAWVDASRLNLVKGLDQHPDTEAVAELQGRFLSALFPAFERLDELAAQVSPAERARIFEPVGQ
jgi:hypothetical protein